MARLKFTALALSIALTGCGTEVKKEAGGRAEGEVLPGSVSDAMLPYDTVTSQPPLAPTSDVASGKPNAKKQAAPKAVPAATSSAPETGSSEAAPAAAASGE